MATLESDYWRLTIQQVPAKGGYTYTLEDRKRNRVFADMDYYYSLSFERANEGLPVDLLRGPIDPEMLAEMIRPPETPALVSREIVEEAGSLAIKGRFSNGLAVLHSFRPSGDGQRLTERISITNTTSQPLSSLVPDFGFRKMLFTASEGWREDTDRWSLRSLPTRRYRSQREDHRLEEYTGADLLYAPFDDGEANLKPGFAAEGWIWGTEEGNILINTYNRSEIEFSRFRRFPIPLPGRGREDTAVLFGGATRYHGDPERAGTLEPGQTYEFGETGYTFFNGAYEDGAYLYRSFLEEKGHGPVSGYDPKIHWNELYNLGWFAELADYYASGTEWSIYTREDLFKEAELAVKAGAEALYLDPGWDTLPGSTLWDQDRLGSLEDFSRIIHEKYGLRLALHLMMTFWSADEDKDFFWRDREGLPCRDPDDALLFRFCPNEHWVKEKTGRLLRLAGGGVDFFMFDFTAFGLDGRGCCSPDHGHEIPMLRQTHAEQILRVIRNIKQACPAVVIEAHDRIRGGLSDYHPVYYQHEAEGSFDELWGYEYMWNPLQDLLSGKALSLYEYNLASPIPLYLHVNENCDIPSMLQFWWYASTVRHIGVGGISDLRSDTFMHLKKALNLYRTIREHLVRGTFYGIDPYAHLHVLKEKGGCLLTLFNVSGREARKNILIDPERHGTGELSGQADFFSGTGESIDGFLKKTEKGISLQIDIPALSPVIALLR